MSKQEADFNGGHADMFQSYNLISIIINERGQVTILCGTELDDQQGKYLKILSR